MLRQNYNNHKPQLQDYKTAVAIIENLKNIKEESYFDAKARRVAKRGRNIGSGKKGN